MCAFREPPVTTLSQKHRDFVSAPLRNSLGEWKRVDCIPGIGPKAADHLRREFRITNVTHILGWYFQDNQDAEIFAMRLQDGDVPQANIGEIVRGLAEWVENNL